MRQEIFVQAGFVALGSVIGGLLRWSIGVVVPRWLGTGFPWATFLINFSSCVFLGWFLTVLDLRLAGGLGAISRDHLRLLVAVGFAGTYSTFSTFEMETYVLLRDGNHAKATLYFFGSAFIGLTAIWLGVLLARPKPPEPAPSVPMKLEGEQTLLRVHLRNTDKHGWAVASDALVESAKKKGLAGATVLRGIMGMDVAGNLLETGRLAMVEHVPVIVEFVDTAKVIGPFLSDLAEIVHEGLATLERAHVLVYRHNTGTKQAVKNPAADSPKLDVPAAVAAFSTLPSSEEFPIMKLSEEGQLLRVFIGESDQWQGQPLYRAIVLKAKELGLAGATVLRGPMGFGANSRVHTANLLALSTDLPVVVEIVDAADKIQTMLPFLDETVTEGLITIEGVRVLRYRQKA